MQVKHILEKEILLFYSNCFVQVCHLNKPLKYIELSKFQVLMTSICLSPSLFFQVYHHQKQFSSPQSKESALKAEKRLTLVPVIFVLVRTWGTLRFIIYMSLGIEDTNKAWEKCLLYLQVRDQCMFLETAYLPLSKTNFA